MACHAATGRGVVIPDQAGTSIAIFIASSAAREAISTGASIASQTTIMTLGTNTASQVIIIPSTRITVTSITVQHSILRVVARCTVSIASHAFVTESATWSAIISGVHILRDTVVAGTVAHIGPIDKVEIGTGW